MTLGSQIGSYRRKQNITQEALARALGVTNQAVSKWESNQCCPDVTLLPKLADFFGISVDELFGRAAPAVPAAPLPWEDDETLRAVLFVGRSLVAAHPCAREISFRYEGPARNVHSAFSVSCGDVEGSVDAGGNANCGDIGGDLNAGGGVKCGDVAGHVQAGGSVSCADVAGNVTADGDVTCSDVEGNVIAGKGVKLG